MTNPRIRTVAVVGGGPAGSTCAARLARAGLEATLFEASPSREKPCGGAIPGAALEEFPHLLDPSLPRRMVREVAITSPSGRCARLSIPGGIHIFKRQELDSFLRLRARAAGATVRHARVRGIRRLPSGRWELETTAGDAGPFDFLVGADGARGIVRRTLATRHQDGLLTLALYGYVPAVHQEEMILEFGAGSDGYLWVFPRADHLSVGACATKGSTPAQGLESDLRRFLDRRCPRAASALGRLKGYHIPADPAPPAAGRGENWALIGDAAGFVDPLTREGIAPAMRSAEALAGALARGAVPSTPALPEDLRLAHSYRRGFFGDDFQDRMIRLARGSPSIARVLSDLLGGRQSYRGLKGRLLRSAVSCGLEMGFGALFRKGSTAGGPEDGRTPGP